MGLFKRKKRQAPMEDEAKWTSAPTGGILCPSCKKTVTIDVETYTTLVMTQYMPNTRVLCPYCSTNSGVDLS